MEYRKNRVEVTRRSASPRQDHARRRRSAIRGTSTGRSARAFISAMPAGYRDDATHHRQKAADEDRKRSPAFEETRARASDAVVREMNVLSVPFDKRHAAVTPDRVPDRAARPTRPQRATAIVSHEIAQMSGGRQRAGHRQHDLACRSAAPTFPKHERDEEADVAVVVDERDDGLLQVLPRSCVTLRARPCFATRRGAESRRPSCRLPRARLRRGRAARSRDPRRALRPARRSRAASA